MFKLLSWKTHKNTILKFNMKYIFFKHVLLFNYKKIEAVNLSKFCSKF